MPLSIDRLCWFFVVFGFCIPHAHYVEAGFPRELEEVDLWWTQSVSNGIIPDIQDLIRDGDPNSVVTVRIFALILQRYLERNQTYAVLDCGRRLSQASPGSLAEIWANANVALLIDGNAHDEPLEELRKQVSILSVQQTEVLVTLFKNYPHLMMGHIALRLLLLNQEGSHPESFACYEDIISQADMKGQGAGCASILGVRRGTASELAEDFDSACFYWIQSLPEYPFQGELRYWSGKLEKALERTGSVFYSTLLQRNATDNHAILCVIKFIRVLRSANKLAQAGNHPEALLSLSEFRAYLLGSTKPVSMKQQMLQELEVQCLASRSASGIDTPGDSLLKKLRYAKGQEFLQLLKNGLSDFGGSKSFCDAALWITHEKADEGKGQPCQAEDYWSPFFANDEVALSARVIALENLLEQQKRKLALMKSVAASPLLKLKVTSHTLQSHIGEEENLYRNVLLRAEDILRRVPITAEVIDFCDRIYSCYAFLGLSGPQSELYFELAKKASYENSYTLAKRAESMGRIEESLKILERLKSTEISPQGTPAETQDATRKLLSLLIHQERYLQAAQVAGELAQFASNTPDENYAWHQAASLYFQAGSYDETLKLVERLISTDLAENYLVVELEKLKTRCLYRLGRYDEFGESVRELLHGNNLTYTEEAEFSRLSSFLHLYKRDYGTALEELRNLLKEYRYDRITEHGIRRVIKQLETKVGH